MKWGNRPYELKDGTRKWNGRLTDCPVCWLLKGQRNKLKLHGKRHPRTDRPVECPVCHRRWESLSWFLSYWCPHWVPRIEHELHVASGADVRNDNWQAEQEAFIWQREQQVKEAVERGWWDDKNPNSIQPLTEQQMEHFDPNKHIPMREQKAPAWLDD